MELYQQEIKENQENIIEKNYVSKDNDKKDEDTKASDSEMIRFISPPNGFPSISVTDGGITISSR